MRKYKILIVEDELIPANYIKKVLLNYGHYVLGIARSEEEVKQYLLEKKIPEIILMDINIGGSNDGIKIAQDIYLNFPSIAIIYLSAYHDEKTLLRADKTNPIGYLVKPIQPESLLSTISISMSNFTRKTSLQKIYFSDTASYDNTTRSITTEEGVTILSKQEASLLMLLLKRAKQFVSYSELENSIWKDNPPRTSALRTTLWRLKKKLPQNVTIENLYDSGYKINF